MLSGRSEIAIALAVAASAHQDFPAGKVPDTPYNRELFARIQAEEEVMEAHGIMPKIPND